MTTPPPATSNRQPSVGLFFSLAIQAPVDLFLDVAPILDVAPKTDFSINAAIGARVFFR